MVRSRRRLHAETAQIKDDPTHGQPPPKYTYGLAHQRRSLPTEASRRAGCPSQLSSRQPWKWNDSSIDAVLEVVALHPIGFPDKCSIQGGSIALEGPSTSEQGKSLAFLRTILHKDSGIVVPRLQSTMGQDFYLGARPDAHNWENL